MARFSFLGRAVDSYGNVKANEGITIYLAGTLTPANIYTARTGGTVISTAPQITTDAYGRFHFYVDESDHVGGDQKFDINAAGLTYYDIEIMRGSVKQEDVEDIVGNLLIEGSNITLTYDDLAGTLEIAGTGGGVTDHTQLTNIGNYSHDELDDHVDDDTIHFTKGNISHTLLQNIGTNTHTQIDTHIGTANIHFLESSIDHTHILNKGTKTHAQIDSHITAGDNHIGDTTIHFTKGSIDHGGLLGLSDNDHPQYVRVSTVNETIDDRVSDLLIAGPNISLTYNDSAGTLEISAYTPEGSLGDHGNLTGLTDDDHPQYALDTKVDSHFASAANIFDILSVSAASVEAARNLQIQIDSNMSSILSVSAASVEADNRLQGQINNNIVQILSVSAASVEADNRLQGQINNNIVQILSVSAASVEADNRLQKLLESEIDSIPDTANVSAASVEADNRLRENVNIQIISVSAASVEADNRLQKLLESEIDSIPDAANVSAASVEADNRLKTLLENYTNTQIISLSASHDEDFKRVTNSGKITGMAISDTGVLNISWSSGQIYSAFTGQYYSINAGSGTCTDNATNYLKWVSGNTLTLNTTLPDINSGEIAIGRIHCQANDIYDIYEEQYLKQRLVSIGDGLKNMFPSVVTSGLIVQEDTDVTNVWDVYSSSGIFYSNGVEKHELAAIYSRVTPMIRWYHSAGVWTSDTNAQIGNTQWDNGTNLVARTANQYYKSLFLLSEKSKIHWIYPQVEYNTLALAIAAPLPTIPPGMGHLVRSVALVMRGDRTAFPTAGDTRWIDVRPRIGVNPAGTIYDHGNLTGLGDDDHTQYVLDTEFNSHVGTTSIHFTEASIDHENIQNIGTYSHTQIDGHIDNSTFHFTENSIDHGSIQGLSDNDHPQYALDTQILSVSAASVEADKDMQININANTANILSVSAASVEADNRLQGQIDTNVTQILSVSAASVEADNRLQTLLEAEIDSIPNAANVSAASVEADNRLQGQIDTNVTQILSVSAASVEADNRLQTLLEAEIDSIPNAANVSAASVEADNRLQENLEDYTNVQILSVSAASIEADNRLQENLEDYTNVQILSVSAASIEADNRLQENLEDYTNVQILSVSAASIEADNRLQENLEDYTNVQILSVSAASIEADNRLQENLEDYTNVQILSVSAASIEADNRLQALFDSIPNVANVSAASVEADNRLQENVNVQILSVSAASIEADNRLKIEIDHENIQNIGTYSHTQIDGHIDNSTFHFTKGTIDHGGILGLADNDHPQYSIADVGIVVDSTPQLGGNLDLNGKNLHHTSILTGNGTYQGEILTATVDDASAVFGNALYCAADFHYERCDADSTATMPCVAIALEAGSGSKMILLKGQICNTAWNWSTGPIYVSVTTGSLTQTVPNGSGDQVQRVGFALSADTLYFDPDNTLIEV